MSNSDTRPDNALDPMERVVTAYAEAASGPGWSNKPLWVIVEDRRTGKMRTICLQPGEQSGDIALLYDVAAAVHRSMMRAVLKTIPLSSETDL